MISRHRRTIFWSALGVAALIGTVLGFPDIMRFIGGSYADTAPDIPVSFSGNRAAYGFSLFSLFTMTSLAIRKLFQLAAQLRDEPWREDPDVGLYRITIALFLAAFVIAEAPDVLLLIIWGEAGGRTLATTMTIGRICDGLAAFPFIAGLLVCVRADQFQRIPGPIYMSSVMHHKIDDFPKPGPRERNLFVVMSQAEKLGENFRIILLVTILAAGLAIWK
jgi:hypothetical protein